MGKSVRIILFMMLIGLLVLVRGFEDILFYDPYLAFFNSDYLYMDNPRREVLKLTIFTSLRFVVNTLVSLCILYVAFLKKDILKFSALFYSGAYMVLISLFLYFVLNPRQEDYYMFFNIRRFLIQPVFLLLLLPAFYYNKVRS
ncbi:exosortase F system-associated membrane protein [Mangrovimonas aestuarii]|uniref:exosortase F system-associated membrane protein n=1 Tax=Mangrovimonas aestuarii TaxID=3018443 RepID=UPI0029E80240|nr:exosortase F system-associated protein [Mangrovimonas aestuarii]